MVAGRKAILIAFLDDHSRVVVAARWGYAETAVALRETLRVGMASRGRPAQVPEAEKARLVSGVAAQYESEVVSTWIMPTSGLCRPR